MPDRETRLTAMLDVVESVAGASPRVLDLAGSTGSITRRLLARLPEATSVVLDLDPVLLSIAQASFDGDDRVLVVEADLTDPTWPAALPPPRRRFDTVLTATAPHWLPPAQVATLYRQLRALLRPGGLLGNADHMPDPGLPPCPPNWQPRRPTAPPDSVAAPVQRTGTAGGLGCGSFPSSPTRSSGGTALHPRPPPTPAATRPARGTSRRCARPATPKPACGGEPVTMRSWSPSTPPTCHRSSIVEGWPDPG